jgi:membrane dipeptidase
MDPYCPAAEEIRAWAANPDALEPVQDWDICVDWLNCPDLILSLATDASCPKQSYFLHILYFLVGSAVRSRFQSPRKLEIEILLDKGRGVDHPLVAEWLRKSEELLASPGLFDYELWCAGGLARHGFQASGSTGAGAGDASGFAVADAHCDFLSRAWFHGDSILAAEGSGPQMTLAGLRRGQVRLQVFAIFVDAAKHPNVVPEVQGQIAAFEKMLEMAEGGLRPIRRRGELGEIAAGTTGAVLALEGAEAIGNDLACLHELFQRGVRLVTLTWNHANAIGNGVGDGVGPAGLTGFGRDVVQEMGRLGMAVDVSHLNEHGFWNVLEISRQPPLASHSNVFELCPHRRNLQRSQIAALVQSGGFIGLNFYPKFLTGNEKAGLDDLRRHLDRFLDLGCENILGFGSDFDGISFSPDGLNGPGDFPRLLDSLHAAGYSEPLLRKLAATNLFDYLERVLP